MEFHSETQKWDCKFCLSSFEESDLEEYNRKQEQKQKEEQEEEEEQYRAEKKCYFCPNCGAELITDEETVATFCTFCGNPSVLPKKLEGEFQPKALIPFKLDKEKAKQALFDLCKRKPLLPKDFTEKTHIEKITGVYVPFWLHDCYVDARMQAVGEKIRVWRTENTEYTKTDLYEVEREAALTYQKPACRCFSKMEDGMMDALEPFSYEDLKKFNMAFYPAILRRDMMYQRKACADRVRERIRKSAEDKLRDTCTDYTTLKVSNVDAQIVSSNCNYVMLPDLAFVHQISRKRTICLR